MRSLGLHMEVKKEPVQVGDSWWNMRSHACRLNRLIKGHRKGHRRAYVHTVHCVVAAVLTLLSRHTEWFVRTCVPTMLLLAGLCCSGATVVLHGTTEESPSYFGEGTTMTKRT